jgi:hypothetical protein
MEWLLLITNIFFIPIQAQNVSLCIIENTVNISEDTLCFKFKIKNNNSKTLVFYNLDVAENGCILFTDSVLQKRQPGLLVNVFNENDELPSVVRARTGRIDLSECAINEYHILKPHESKEYDVVLDLWPINLKKGTYKLQLKYYSNDFYNNSIKEAKKTNPELKYSVMFKGILRSNIVSLIVD